MVNYARGKGVKAGNLFRDGFTNNKHPGGIENLIFLPSLFKLAITHSLSADELRLLPLGHE